MHFGKIGSVQIILRMISLSTQWTYHWQVKRFSLKIVNTHVHHNFSAKLWSKDSESRNCEADWSSSPARSVTRDSWAGQDWFGLLVVRVVEAGGVFRSEESRVGKRRPCPLPVPLCQGRTREAGCWRTFERPFSLCRGCQNCVKVWRESQSWPLLQGLILMPTVSWDGRL